MSTICETSHYTKHIGWIATTVICVSVCCFVSEEVIFSIWQDVIFLRGKLLSCWLIFCRLIELSAAPWHSAPGIYIFCCDDMVLFLQLTELTIVKFLKSCFWGVDFYIIFMNKMMNSKHQNAKIQCFSFYSETWFYASQCSSWEHKSHLVGLRPRTILNKQLQQSDRLICCEHDTDVTTQIIFPHCQCIKM